jgi:acyl-CoA reductase-like NAD-dependent aldehyde dehydrogenase
MAIEVQQATPASRELADAQLFVGGDWVAQGSAPSVGHVSPVTGEVQAQVAMAGPAEIDTAVAAARAALPAWRALPGDARRRSLQRIEQLVERDTPELARRTTLELGLPVTPAGHYPPMAAAYFGYYAGWADKIEGATIPLVPPTGFNYTVMEPYGVVGIIITWNGPLASIGMKVAPALAAGNCVILKSPELAPFAAEHFARLADEAGVPAGVLSVLPGGPDAGERLVRHRDVAKISFTGGGVTARKIMDAARETITPLALELGGKSANLLFADADLGDAVPRALNQCMANAGQGCSFPTRLLVERPVYDDVVTRLADLAGAVRVGDPWLPETQMGPVVCADAIERILGMIERGKRTARLVAGGNRLGGDLAAGFFLEPTVFADVVPDNELFQGEVFGPVLSVTPFDTEDEAVALANNTVYGLAAYIQSRDIARVQRLVPRLDAGTVHVNGKSAMPPSAPFGGYGESGYGREGGKAGLDEFLQIKNVFVQSG